MPLGFCFCRNKFNSKNFHQPNNEDEKDVAVIPIQTL